MSSICLDDDFIKDDIFDSFDISISNHANQIDENNLVYEIQKLTIYQKINLLRCFLSSLSHPLIPFECYDIFMDILNIKNEQQQIQMLNQNINIFKKFSN